MAMERKPIHLAILAFFLTAPLQAAHAIAIGSGEIRNFSLSLSGLEAVSRCWNFARSRASSGLGPGDATSGLGSTSCTRIDDKWVVEADRLNASAEAGDGTYYPGLSYWNSGASVEGALLGWGAPAGTQVGWNLEFSSLYSMEVTGFPLEQHPTINSFREVLYVWASLYLYGAGDQGYEVLLTVPFFADALTYNLVWDFSLDPVGPEPIIGSDQYSASGVFTTVKNYSSFSYSFHILFDARSRTVPEPSTLALLGLGLAGIGLTRRRKT